MTVNHSASGKSWADILKSSNPKNKTSSMDFSSAFSKISSSTKERVVFSSEQISSLCELWSASLIGNFFRKPPHLDVICSWASRLWYLHGFQSVLDLDEKNFIFHFNSIESANFILTGGPWSLRGDVLRLIPWKPLFKPWEELFTTAPIWLRLQSLPLEFWNLDCIKHIAGNFGLVLRVNERSFSFERGHYVRVCVEVNLALPLRQGVWISADGFDFFQSVCYENLPSVCFQCAIIGHRESNYPTLLERKNKHDSGIASSQSQFTIVNKSNFVLDGIDSMNSDVIGNGINANNSSVHSSIDASVNVNDMDTSIPSENSTHPPRLLWTWSLL
ncbi:hypothetical protein Cni_G06511 [Canna indica]|uniref:DUF4283 domain-containing protein n=1 Tax=Canna indica TaxID=4628 RepID=A0AAQ3JX44_9LILI|nr:hypothetical protein Cni_G06511 [Canna indica]